MTRKDKNPKIIESADKDLIRAKTAEQSAFNQSLYLPTISKPQSVNQSIRAKIGKIKPKRYHNNAFRFIWLLPCFLAVISILVGANITENEVWRMYFIYAGVVLFCTVSLTVPYASNRLQKRHFRIMKEVLTYNAEVAAYVADLKQSGKPFTKEDYLFLNIEQQYKIIKTERLKQRLRDIAYASVAANNLPNAEQSPQIKIDSFKPYPTQKLKWVLLKQLNYAAFTLFCLYMICFGLLGDYMSMEFHNIAQYVGGFSLLFLTLNTFYLIVNKGFHQDFIYNQVYYDNLYTLSQYNPEIKNYIRQVLGENRLLTREDLKRLKLDEQIEAIAIENSADSIKHG